IVSRPAGSFERAVKWARRRPAAAALVGVSAAAALVLVATLTVSTYLISRKQAATEKANEDLRDANARIVAEEARTRRPLQGRPAALAGDKHAACGPRIGLAYDQGRQDNAPRAEQLLDSCPAPLRRWEWHYVRRLLHAERFSIEPHAGGLGVVVFS